MPILNKHSALGKKLVSNYKLSNLFQIRDLTMISFHFSFQVFRGNFDRDSIVAHNIFPPFHARYVRIHPLTWYSHISMRAELYGCPIKVRIE